MKNNKSVIAIGAGPSGLSLSALSTATPDVSVTVLEKEKHINWHPGLMLEDTRLQSSALKDLVTPVDPTNPYSFLSYLRAKNRLYSALVNGLSEISRYEFEDYLRWVAHSLPNLQFGETVHEIDCDAQSLIVRSSACTYRTRSVVLSVGKTPFIPEFARHCIFSTLFHSKEFAFRRHLTVGKTVTVVGGGQSGAEIVLSLLVDKTSSPASINWVSRRSNLFMLENSPFINEWFHPGYQHWFSTLSASRRQQLLTTQRMASDGVSEKTLNQLYDKLYQHKVQKIHKLNLSLSSSVETISDSERGGHKLAIKHSDTGVIKTTESDVVILATGYRNVPPAFLDKLRPRLNFIQQGVDEEIVVDTDFSTHVEGTNGCRVYVQNGTRFQHGISNPNLALLAMRSARILNAISDTAPYDTNTDEGLVNWSSDPISVVEKDIVRPMYEFSVND